MRIALRMAACCLTACVLTVTGTSCPRGALADEAVLRRTAPDECIAWFSWAGLDSLGKSGADTENRTEQLLADEEVRAFLDSITKSIGGAIAEDADEETEIALRIARTLAARPAVAFLSKIEQAERALPPHAPEQETPPPTQAIIAPTTQVTVGDDGIERIGIDFDVEVTAGDTAIATSAVETNPNSPAVQRPVFVDIDDVVAETKTGRVTSRGHNASPPIADTIPPSIPGTISPPGVAVRAAPPACATCQLTSTTTVVHGAVVVDLGGQTAEMRALFDKIESESVALPRKSIAGVEFARIDIDMDQSLWVAFDDTFVILAFDESTAAQVVAGLSGEREAPAWLAELDKKLPVERPAARVHVNVDALVKLADEPFEDETKAAVKMLGLDQVSAISWVAGLDEVGTAVKTLVATRDGGDVSLVLDVFGTKGLNAGDLKAIPRDATMAAAGKFDAQQIVELGVKLAALDDDDAETAWEAVKNQLAEQMFIDLSKDLLDAVGDTWTLHYSPSEGGLMATTFTLAVRDEVRLTAALEKLALVANAEDAYVRKFTYRGQDVYYFQGGEDGGSAAWCIRDGRLVASMLPQTIKAYIARGELKETLADVPEVSRILAGVDEQSGPLVLTYTDTRDILRWCYQYGSFLLPTIGQALSEAKDFGFALHEIPSLAVIEQYFAPSITTVSRTDAGLLIDSRQTVPFTSGLVALSTLSGLSGGVYEMAFDDSGLGDVAQLAESVVDVPLGISFGSPTNSMQCIGGACSPYPEAMPTPPVAASPAMGPTSPPSTSYQPGPTYQPGATLPPSPAYQPGPTSQPSPYRPATPNVTPVPYKVTRSVGEPYVSPPATPPGLPADVPATYQRPARAGVPVEGKRKVFTPSYNAPQKPASVPDESTPIGLPAVASGHGAPAVIWSQPGRSPAAELPPANAAYPAAPYPGINPYAPPLQKSAQPDDAPAVELPPSNGVAPGAAYEIPTYRPADASAYVPDISLPGPTTRTNDADAASKTPGDVKSRRVRESRRSRRRRAALNSPVKTSQETSQKAVYVLEPADILSIDMSRAVPKSPYLIGALDTLQIVVEGTPDGKPIAGVYAVDPGGDVQLGEAYGSVEVNGLALVEAREAIESHVRGSLVDPKVSISIAQIAGRQQIVGEHLVGLDGMVDLGGYGSVHVAGLTLDQARNAIEEHLGKTLSDVNIQLDAFAYNSKVCYVVIEDAQKEKDSRVVRLPLTGDEKALDAVKSVSGSVSLANKNIWIARPSVSGNDSDMVLPVQWRGVPKRYLLAHNHEILPGDRIIVTHRRMPAFTASF